MDTQKTEILKRFQDINDRQPILDFFDILTLLITKLDINADNPQLALNIRNESNRKRISVNINSRLVLCLTKQHEGVLELGFMMHNRDFERLKYKYPIVFWEFFSGGNNAPCLVRLKATDYNPETFGDLLDAFFNCCAEYLPKQSASQYRVHHMSMLYEMATNKVLLEELIDETNILTSNIIEMEYFNLQGMANYARVARQQYNANSPDADWYKETHFKFDYLVSLLKDRFALPLAINYKQRPVSQAMKFRDYVLRGFTKQPLFSDGSVFIKLMFCRLNESIPHFVIELDINDKLNPNPFRQIREELLADSWSVPVDQSFPDNWEQLINLIEPQIKEKIAALESLTASMEMPIIKTLKESTYMNTKFPLNTILYGPPGTGKTYSTINYAMAIIEGKSIKEINKNDRTELKKRFDDLIIQDWDNAKGQIGFITFHQSLSYEDFIEGIKPIPPFSEDGEMTYQVVDGIFKRMVQIASIRGGNFEAVIDQLKIDTYEGSSEPITIRSASTTFDLKYNGGPTFYIHPHSAKKVDSWYPVNIFHIHRYFELDSLEGAYNGTYVREIVHYLKKERGLRKLQVNETDGKPYVLIIDEINRGNVSQIFGELITLIEDGRRMGQAEELVITLPYSREALSIPSNLYFIGTMNTADRSVEALDTALRRRFVFEHMPSIPELLKKIDSLDVDPQKMLQTINERLELLLDADRTIGHAWLMGINSLDKLRETFRVKVLPLLQEFFFNDLGKIGLILGDAFLVEIKADKNSFARFSGFGEYGDYKNIRKYKLANVENLQIEHFQSIYDPHIVINNPLPSQSPIADNLGMQDIIVSN